MIYPNLFTRLIDLDPLNRKAPAAPGDGGIASYKKSVRRDLTWLLNTVSHPSDSELLGYEQVSTSVLNFGTPNPSGSSMADLDVDVLCQQIETAIETFEPRLLRGTVRVVPQQSRGALRATSVDLVITAQLRVGEDLEDFRLNTNLDPERGRWSVAG